jgi:transposase
MAGKDILMMSRKEIRRLHVIKKVIEGGVKGKEAAECLDISDRQIRRIVNRVREEGEEGIRHRLRGIESKRKISEEIKEKAVKVYREKYDGFGPTLACEKMNEDEGIEVSDETLRKWLIEAGEWKRRSWGKTVERWCRWMVPIMIGLKGEERGVF